MDEHESVADPQSNAAKLMAREGARHLYLLDFSKQVESFSETLQKDFPGTKVSSQRIQASFPPERIRGSGVMLTRQVTSVVADAASAQAISTLVDRVINEEGHLDFFFANAGITMLPQFRTGDMESQLRGGARRMTEISEEEFAEVMRINALR